MNPSIYKPRYVVDAADKKPPSTVSTKVINEIKKLLTTRTMGALCKVQMLDSKKVSRPFIWK